MSLSVIDLGIISFKEAFSRQVQTHRQILQGISSHTLFLCEHPHTITLPKHSSAADVLDMNVVNDGNIDFIVGVNRGGAITYHGPGQLVGYLIFDLREFGRDLGWFLSTIEHIIIKTISKFGMEGHTKEGFRGVWVGKRKIASIGIGVDKWVSLHGFALNINTDMSFFGKIRPCGLDVEMTSMNEISKNSIDAESVKKELVNQVFECFEEFPKAFPKAKLSDSRSRGDPAGRPYSWKLQKEAEND